MLFAYGFHPLFYLASRLFYVAFSALLHMACLCSLMWPLYALLYVLCLLLRVFCISTYNPRDKSTQRLLNICCCLLWKAFGRKSTKRVSTWESPWKIMPIGIKRLHFSQIQVHFMATWKFQKAIILIRTLGCLDIAIYISIYVYSYLHVYVVCSYIEAYCTNRQ